MVRYANHNQVNPTNKKANGLNIIVEVSAADTIQEINMMKNVRICQVA